MTKSTARFTLVLGGGGVAGIAWETGVIAGLADEGVDVTAARASFGTSAGAAVAAQVTSGVPIERLYENQLAGVPFEISNSLSVGSTVKFVLAQLLPGNQHQSSRRVGKFALHAAVGLEAKRHAVIEKRLPSHSWPDADLHIVVVDALTGVERIITQADGIALVDAVEASCAVPMVWPAVELDGRVYIDGGVRSPANLDLAPGDGPVIALVPLTIAFRRANRIAEQVKALAPRKVEVVEMSPEAKAAQGRNSLDNSVVPAVAVAGREQGRREAARIRAAIS
ncbi:MAG: patatin-like phospholipase family protein [Rhodoglobus sp.]|uniref:patatin-like phospholipase family protein n=1 Tax=uncultured Salinibacterium sp. TaxID=459274 RepID=UPI0030D7F0AE